VVYARVPDSLKQSLHAHAAKRGLSLTQALVELVERGLEAIATETSIAELERKLTAATSELAETRGRLNDAEPALQGRARAGAAHGPHLPSARRAGPAGPCRLPALPQARARLRPAGQRPLPQTATRRAPHRCCRPEPQTSSKTNTSRCWARSASSSASRSLPPIRTQPDRHAAAPAHALHNVSTTSTPPGSEPARRAKNLPTDPKTHRPNVTRPSRG
jgi:hypothetical protein